MADLSAELYGNEPKELTRGQDLALELYGESALSDNKNDVLKSAAIGIPKGLISIPGMFGDIGQMIDPQPNLVIDRKPVSPPTVMQLLSIPTVGKHPLALMPKSKDIQSQIESVTGEFYQPKTKGGEYAQALTAGASAAGTLGGKVGLIDRLIAGALSGVGSKAGGEVAGTPGALLGGMIAPLTYGVARGVMSSNPADMLKRNTEGITEQQWQQAQALIAKAKAQGVDLTVPEALNTPSILGLAGDVRSSPSGSATMTNFLNNRATNQVQPAINNFAGNFPITSQREAGAAAQTAATDIISNAEKARSAAWRNPNGATLPTNEVLQASTIPPNHIQAIVTQIDDALRYQPKNSPAYSELIKLKTQISGETNAATLFNIKKSLDAAIESPEINANSMEKTARGVLSPINKTLNNILLNNVQQYKTANQLYKNATTGIDELNASPIGSIAGKQGFELGDQPQFAKAKGQLFGASNSTREVGNTANALGDATPKMTNAYLTEQGNLAGTRNRPGEIPQDVGARFAQNIGANPAQRENLLTVLKTIDKKNGGLTKFSKEAQDLIDTLEATGRIPGVGSPTATRAANAEMAGRSTLGDAVNITKGSVLSTTSKALHQRAFSKTYEALAKAITENDVPQIRAIINKSPQLRKQLFTAYIAGVNAERNQE